MKKFLVLGFRFGVWGTYELFTVPEMLEQRAAEKNIKITAICEQ